MRGIVQVSGGATFTAIVEMDALPIVGDTMCVRPPRPSVLDALPPLVTGTVVRRAFSEDPDSNGWTTPTHLYPFIDVEV